MVWRLHYTKCRHVIQQKHFFTNICRQYTSFFGECSYFGESSIKYSKWKKALYQWKTILVVIFERPLYFDPIHFTCWIQCCRKKYSFFISSYSHTYLCIYIYIFRVSVWLFLLCVYCTRVKWKVCYFPFTHTQNLCRLLCKYSMDHWAHDVYTVYTVYTCNATRLNVDCLRMAVFICQMSMRFCIKMLINQCPLYHDKWKIDNYYTITIINFHNFVLHFLIVNHFYIKIFPNTNHLRYFAFQGSE